MMNEFDFMQRYQGLKDMRFSAMASEFKEQYENWEEHNYSSEERIFRLIDAETEVRRNKKFNRLLKASGLRYRNASMNSELFEAEGVDRSLLEKLSEGSWLERAENLLITGKTGAGKSYCVRALAVAAMSKSKKVRYFKASELLRILLNAEAKMELIDEINSLSKVDLLIVDDFGLMRLDIEMCRNLFDLIDVRDGRKSNLFISQFPVCDWYELFKDNTFADACLDRLTGGAHRLEFLGESYRKKKNEKRKNEPAKAGKTNRSELR